QEVRNQIRNSQQDKITSDCIYQLLLAFDEVYSAASEAEKKEFMRAFIERIDLYPEKQKCGNWIRNIVFNFPIPFNGEEVKELALSSKKGRETVISLSQRNLDDHIEFSIELDNLDTTPTETKATYQAIKNYVKEQTGLNVTPLYIAQVKQKCGIIERECYNKPKSENSKQPQCPPEKEKAIREA